LWLATGHEGLGITTALATAELIACDFIGSEPAIPCEPYLPARFEPTPMLEQGHAELAHPEPSEREGARLQVAQKEKT
jgi:hypothetical protein